jgi:tetratricopeptide (TPR) repeat protein
LISIAVGATGGALGRWLQIIHARRALLRDAVACHNRNDEEGDDRAVADLTDLLQRWPDDAAAGNLLAVASAEREVEDGDPIAISPPLPASANSAIAEAYTAIATGNTDAVLAATETVADGSADAETAHYLAASAELLVGRTDDAQRDVGVALLGDPTNARAIALRGEVLLAASRPADAVAALVANPGLAPDPRVQAVLLRAQVAAGMPDQATTTALAVRARLDDAWLAPREAAWAELALASYDEATGDGDDAGAELAAAEAINPIGDPRLFEKLARAHLVRWELDKAMADADRALEQAPNLVEAQLLRAECEIDEGRSQDALAIISAQPVSDQQTLLRSRALAGLGRLDEAVRLLPPLEASPSLSPVVKAAHVDELVAGGRAADGIAAGKAALALQPRDASIADSLGLAELQAGNGEAASGPLGVAAAAIPPAGLRARVALAGIDAGLGYVERALAEVDSVRRLAPGLVDAVLIEGALLTDVGQGDAAVAMYRGLLAGNPTAGPALVGLARALTLRGDLDGSASALDAASKVSSPLDASLLREQGRLSLAQGSTVDALRFLARARAEDPMDVEAETLEGTTLLEDGNVPRAIHDLADACARTESPDALLGLGHAWTAAGDADRATAYLAQAVTEMRVSLRPDAAIAAALSDLGHSQLAEGDPTRAAGTLGHAIDLMPSSARPLADLALAQDELGDWTDAADNARRALTLDTGSESAHFALGDASLHLGDRATARSELEAYLALDPGGRQADDAATDLKLTR